MKLCAQKDLTSPKDLLRSLPLLHVHSVVLSTATGGKPHPRRFLPVVMDQDVVTDVLFVTSQRCPVLCVAFGLCDEPFLICPQQDLVVGRCLLNLVCQNACLFIDLSSLSRLTGNASFRSTLQAQIVMDHLGHGSVGHVLLGKLPKSFNWTVPGSVDRLRSLFRWLSSMDDPFCCACCYDTAFWCYRRRCLTCAVFWHISSRWWSRRAPSSPAPWSHD